VRVELLSAGEQLLATRPALIDTGGVRVVVLARVRPLGARLPEYLELLRRQFLTPLLLTLGHAPNGLNRLVLKPTEVVATRVFRIRGNSHDSQNFVRRRQAHHRLVVLRHVEEVWSDGILDNSTPDPGC